MAQKAMTQTQIVKAMAEACEVSNAKAREVLTFLSDTAIKEVKKNGLFVVPGIGRLVRVERKARIGRNPTTGETIKIAAKKAVKFRIAKSAKDAIVPPKVKKEGSTQFKSRRESASANMLGTITDNAS